jgi:hypothetical protein
MNMEDFVHSLVEFGTAGREAADDLRVAIDNLEDDDAAMALEAIELIASVHDQFEDEDAANSLNEDDGD